MQAEELHTQLELLRRERDRLAARLQHIVAHIQDELAQPLASLQDMTSLLQSSGLHGDQGGYVDVIRRTADDMEQVLRSVAAMTVPDMTCTEESEGAFDIFLLLEDVSAVFRALARREGLQTDMVIDEDVPCQVVGRPGVVRRLVSVLVHELLTAPADSTISLRVTVAERDGQRVRLRCSGMVDGLLTTLDEERCRMLQELADCVDGHFEFHVRDGRTELLLVFSLRVREDEHGDLPGPQPIDGRSLLVVDRDATWRSVVRELCSLWGCAFQEVPDAAGALTLLREAAAAGREIDFVLTDKDLGTMTVHEFGQAVRADSTLGHPLLVMVASGARAGDAARMEEAGYDAFLARPVSQRRLRDSLRLLLGRRQQGRQGLVTRHVVAEDSKHRQRILIVDDNATNLMVAKLMLKRGGYACDGVHAAEEGLEMMQRESYALVYMDISMPGMNGFEAVRHIRRTLAGTPESGLPVVALTAHVVDGRKDEYLEAGFSDVLEKPLDYTRLLQVTERYLQQDSGDESVAVDVEALQQQLDQDRDIVRDVLQTFVREAGKRVREFQELCGAGDLVAAGEKAHALIGMSGNIRARGLCSLSEQAEQACLRQNSVRAQEVAADMEMEMDRIRRVAASV